MKFLHVLIGFLLSVVVLIGGWLLLAGLLGIQYAASDILLSSRIWRSVAAISLIVLALLFWVTALPFGKREQFLSFDSEGGMVSISVNAVNVFLAKLKAEFAGIVDLRADVAASRDGAIEVRLDMAVKAGTHIQQLSQALQQRVRDSMRESLGIAEVASVKVNVEDIVAAEENSKDQPAPSAAWQDSDT